jgi:hypothetical protein
VVVDEVSPFMSAHAKPPQFLTAYRAFRHNGICFHMTTQYIGDVAPVTINCTDEFWVFRNTAPSAIDRIAESFPAIPAHAVQSLPNRSFFHHTKLM